MVSYVLQLCHYYRRVLSFFSLHHTRIRRDIISCAFVANDLQLLDFATLRKNCGHSAQPKHSVSESRTSFPDCLRFFISAFTFFAHLILHPFHRDAITRFFVVRSISWHDYDAMFHRVLIPRQNHKTNVSALCYISTTGSGFLRP